MLANINNIKQRVLLAIPPNNSRLNVVFKCISHKAVQVTHVHGKDAKTKDAEGIHVNFEC